MFKAMIFDMDGVIIDSEPFHEEVNLNIFKELGINAGSEECRKYIGSSHTEMWSTIKKNFLLPHSVEDLVNMQVTGNLDYLKHNDFDPIPGIMTLLEELKINNILTGVASSAAMESIEIVAEKLDIKKFFDVLVSGEHMEKSKPDPQIFLHTAKILKVEPENCLVIEDAQKGVMASKRAGMKCVGFKNPNSGNQDLSLADLIIEKIEELNVELIKEMFNQKRV